MSTTWEESEEVYRGVVPVALKHLDREERSTALTVAISYTTGQPRNQKVLHIQLTDETDAFLLYTLDISEDDFHVLKNEQNILVDFATFPSKFIELLRQCQGAASEEHPHYVVQLSTQTGAPILTVIETNQFRQLAHIALRFVAGNDAAIKRYLAGRVADFKSQLLSMSDELGDRTHQLQESSELAAMQGERLRTLADDHARTISELVVRQAGALAAAKEEAAATQQEQTSQGEQERARLLERSETELSALRRAHMDGTAQTTQLTATVHELEMKLRENTSRLQGAEQECALLKGESSTLREENSKLSAKGHRQEKELAERDLKLAAALQSIQDKEHLLAKMTSLHEAATEAKRQVEDSLTLYKDNHSRLQEKLKLSSDEITKGNSIIAKLQSDCRELKGKLKLKAAVLLQQQEHSQGKHSELEAAERNAAELRALNAEMKSEKARAEEGHEACKQQLAEAQELLRSNQQVIQWLNKELNELQTGGRPYVSIPNRVSSFRPSVPSTLKAMGGAPATASSVGGSAGATGSSTAAASFDQSIPILSASSLSSGFKSTANMDTVSAGTDAPAPTFVPGAALASLRSRAGIALAEGLQQSDRSRLAGGDATNTTGSFSDYLSPSSGVPPGGPAIGIA